MSPSSGDGQLHQGARAEPPSRPESSGELRAPREPEARVRGPRQAPARHRPVHIIADYATLAGETPQIGGPFAQPESPLTAITR